MRSVNIILSSYNGEKYISEQINSIVNLNYRDFKLFVYDDCSEDSTVETVKAFKAIYPDRIELIENNANKGSTLNFLSSIKELNKSDPARYYMFCDQDDIWLLDKIDISLNAMRRLERKHGTTYPLIVYNDAILIDKDGEYICSSFYKTNKLKVKKTDFGRTLMENKCIGCTMFMNKAVVNLINEIGPDIRYHDWWMALIASAFGKIKYIKSPTILYRQHDSNQVGQRTYGDYVKQRSSSSDDIRRRLEATIVQAEYFRKCYSGRLSRLKKKKLNAFIKIRYAGFWRKRYIIIKNRFFKSGLIRNIGLLWYI